MLICFGLICFLFFSIVIRIGTRFLIKISCCPASIAEIVFFDQKQLQTRDYQVDLTGSAFDTKDKLEYVNWREMYPFNNEIESKLSEKINNRDSLITKYNGKVQAFENKINEWCGHFLVGYSCVITFYNHFESLIHLRNSLDMSKYEQLMYNHWTKIVAEVPIDQLEEKALNIQHLAQFLAESNTPMYFYLAPYKMHETEPNEGISTFANTNADRFLSLLCNLPILVHDLRKDLGKTKEELYSHFYYTDHHWKAETGFDVAALIANDLSKSMDIEKDFIDSKNFSFTVHEKSLLGSHGRFLTLARTEMEDITKIEPLTSPELHVALYNNNMLEKNTGSFDCLLFEEHLQDSNTAYEKNGYAMYMNGDTVCFIRNDSVSNNSKVLILGDSFTDVVEPFLALTVHQLDCIDTRIFDGSLESFIAENGPYDGVVLLVNPETLTWDINYDTHVSLWDFR